MRFLFVLCLLLCSAAAGFAGEEFPILERGFSEFRGKGGAGAAFARWFADRPQPEPQLETLRRLVNAYGDFKGYEIVRTIPVGGQSTLVYVTAQMDRGAIFFRFVIHQRLTGQVVNLIGISDDPEKIFPERLLLGKP